MQNARNTVVLKNLPSNLIEEAFIILKKNHKAIKLDFVNNSESDFESKEENDYIIKEAELLVNNCIESQEGKAEYYKKYRKVRRIAYLLGISLFCLLIYILL